MELKGGPLDIPCCVARSVSVLALRREWRCTAEVRSRQRIAEDVNFIKQRQLTGRQTQAKLGVKRTTLSRWRTTGHIKARICNELGEWLYWLPPEEEHGVTDATPTQKDNSTAGGAV